MVVKLRIRAYVLRTRRCCCLDSDGLLCVSYEVRWYLLSKCEYQSMWQGGGGRARLMGLVVAHCARMWWITVGGSSPVE